MDQNKEKSLQISARYALQFYGESLYLFDTYHGFEEYQLNSVEADILLLINKLHILHDVFSQLSKDYNLSADSAEVHELFDAFISRMEEREILETGNLEHLVVGVPNTCYPIIFAIELTDRCNLECSHCYKDAMKRNSCYIPTQFVETLFKDISGKTWHVEFTGGEATLHPDFEHIIEKASFPSMALLTNGSRLSKISLDILKKFNNIQVSCYGASANEYQEYTKSGAFNSFCTGIKRLTAENIDTTIALILRKTNFRRLEEYASMFSDLGVKDIRFGLTRKLGRNSDGVTEWDMSYDECLLFDDVLSEVKQKFPSLQFLPFNWKHDYESSFVTKEHYQIGCSAGRKSIVISEHEKVRPCTMMPADYFGKFTWDEYKKIIDSGNQFDFSGCVEDCLQAYKKQGKRLDSICGHAFI